MPAAPRLDDGELLARLLEVFRAHGYEGASLTRISAATGLQRPSLYHRFPGGKQDMAVAVLDAAHARFGQQVLAPLSGKGAPSTRLRAMATALAEFYADGKASCLLDTLSLPGAPAEVRRRTKRTLGVLRSGLAEIASEAGFTPAAARHRADDAVIAIQGALVVARVAGDREPFQRVLKDLPRRLTTPPGR